MRLLCPGCCTCPGLALSRSVIEPIAYTVMRYPRMARGHSLRLRVHRTLPAYPSRLPSNATFSPWGAFLSLSPDASRYDLSLHPNPQITPFICLLKPSRHSTNYFSYLCPKPQLYKLYTKHSVGEGTIVFVSLIIFFTVYSIYLSLLCINSENMLNLVGRKGGFHWRRMLEFIGQYCLV